MVSAFTTVVAIDVVVEPFFYVSRGLDVSFVCAFSSQWATGSSVGDVPRKIEQVICILVKLFDSFEKTSRPYDLLSAE